MLSFFFVCLLLEMGLCPIYQTEKKLQKEINFR